MALDVGDVRIGIALSDPFKMIANPYETYQRKRDDKIDAEYIGSLAAAKEVDLIVSGLPRNMKGEDSLQTEKTRAFVRTLEEVTGLKIVFIDERLTTASANRVLLQGNVRREKRKEVIDKVAATIILQNYLDYYVGNNFS